MAVAGPNDPWVLDLRGRVEKALEAAIVPLRVSANAYSSYVYIAVNGSCDTQIEVMGSSSTTHPVFDLVGHGRRLASLLLRDTCWVWCLRLVSRK